MKPLVSVIIPAYNAEQFLEDCLTSVFDQTYPAFEVILVDDGSTDATARVCAKFADRLKYIYQANRGPAAARNTGFRLAAGEFLTCIDADDLCPPGRLAGQLAVFTANPDAELAIGKTRLFRESEVSRQAFASLSMEEMKTGDLPGFSPPSSSYLLGAFICRVEVLTKVGLLNEELWVGEDSDWFLRVREAGVKILLSDQTALFYRRHPGGMTANREGLPESILHLFKRSLDRRRQSWGTAAELAPHLFQSV